MFTRCPECLTVHALNASLLAHAGGAVRCGHCKNEFSALAYLFDHWPDATSSPPSVGAHSGPPVLGQVSSARPVAAMAPDAGTGASEPEIKRNSGRLAWKLVCAILIAITFLNLAWTFRTPLMERVEIRNFLTSVGLMEPVPQMLFQDLSRLHLVSRDMHKHPTRAGMLALSVTFVNRAERVQRYPNIEVTLSDVANEPLARREFKPLEYLPEGNIISRGLAPDVHVLVLLEFADPGSSAVGFELNFK